MNGLESEGRPPGTYGYYHEQVAVTIHSVKQK